jgi:hypothetical protein
LSLLKNIINLKLKKDSVCESEEARAFVAFKGCTDSRSYREE